MLQAIHKKVLNYSETNSFDNLFKGDYIPAAIKEELRQEALVQGLIGGTTGETILVQLNRKDQAGRISIK